MTIDGVNTSQLKFRKATASDTPDKCVEAAPLPGGGAVVRDSKNPDGAVLSFTAGEWTAFLAGAKGGEFDF